MEVHDIYMYGVVGEEFTADRLQRELNKAQGKDIVLHINSPGGFVYDGWTIGNKLASLPQKVTAQIEGYCGSIATYIALLCDRVEMADTARFMIHNPSSGVEGGAREMRKEAEQLDKIKEDLVRLYQKKTKKSIDKINEWVDAETEFTTDEAIEYGFVDARMPRKQAVALFKQTNMEPKVKEEIESGFSKVLNELKKLISGKEPVNMVVELQDGNKIFIESEDGEFPGKRAFLADAEGNPTESPAPNGEHLLTDGRKITVEDGVVTAVTEDATAEEDEDEMAALKAQVETLKAEKAAVEEAKAQAEQKVTDLENKFKDQESTVSELVTQVQNLSKRALGQDFNPTKAVIQPVNKFDNQQETKEADPMTRWALEVANRQGIPVKKQ